MSQLTDEELRAVLARAEEIQRASRQGPEWNAEVAAVISAGTEVGLSRQAIERALKERFNLASGPPATGSLAWARSADGKFYIAEVVGTSEHDASVRFLGGSEHTVTLDQLRPCSLIPGERVGCNWPWWGPWTCSVVSYDPAKQKVKLADGWGDIKTFGISEVWLAPEKADPGTARSRVRVRLLAAGAALGAIAGSVITALLFP